mmetsp:Transcript_22962/g.62300  ORF Transcript_22962/g.62300 Transcript_22962/m.62300 type:complete len:305 (-) Transcript_22962:1091-2005(-)
MLGNDRDKVDRHVAVQEAPPLLDCAHHALDVDSDLCNVVRALVFIGSEGSKLMAISLAFCDTERGDDEIVACVAESLEAPETPISHDGVTRLEEVQDAALLHNLVVRYTPREPIRNEGNGASGSDADKILKRVCLLVLGKKLFGLLGVRWCLYADFRGVDNDATAARRGSLSEHGRWVAKLAGHGALHLLPSLPRYEVGQGDADEGNPRVEQLGRGADTDAEQGRGDSIGEAEAKHAEHQEALVDRLIEPARLRRALDLVRGERLCPVIPTRAVARSVEDVEVLLHALQVTSPGSLPPQHVVVE